MLRLSPSFIGTLILSPLVALASAGCSEGKTQTTPTGSGGGGAGGAGGGGAGGDDILVPNASPCKGHAGELLCMGNIVITCNASEEKAGEENCGEQACVVGQGCALCIAGQVSCDGNTLRSCDVAGSPTWTDTATCVPETEVCSEKQGACVPLKETGGTAAKGNYYRFARFTAANSPFLGGFDIDSYDNFLYVNRAGGHLDVYTVELLDTDADGKLEPNQHPDNPNATGPIEERVLTFVKTIDIPELGPVNSAELYAQKDRIYWVVGYPDKKGMIYEHVFDTGVTTKIIDAPVPHSGLAFLGRDELTGTWYSGVHYERIVYSYYAPSNIWIPEFQYPNLAGDHMDGMEVVTDPNTGTTYVYVSDMTSDFIAQYVRTRGNEWVQENVFAYDGTADMVEGMGFGALNHFWVSGYPEEDIYELGGGDLAKYTETGTPK